MNKRIKFLLLFILCVTLVSIPEAATSGKTEFVPGILIVKVKNNPSFRTQAGVNDFEQCNRQLGLLKKEELRFSSHITAQNETDKTYILTLPESTDILAAAKRYTAVPEVIYAEPNYYVYAFGSPNDTEYPNQTYFADTELNQIFQIPLNNEIVVAVVDTGVDYNHPDLKYSLKTNTQEIPNNGLDDDNNGLIDDYKGYNFYGYYNHTDQSDAADYYGHGTHIAGIIAAESNNRIGVCGLNPNARILNVCFLNSDGRGNQIDAAAAIRYAANQGARILNCSWGYPQYSSILHEAIEYASFKGCIIIAAAGNSGRDIIEYPAGFRNVWAIGAIDSDKKPTYFSSYGEHVLFAEYGLHVLSTVPNQKYSTKSGTSQSAAIFSGVASRILSANPNFDRNTVLQTLMASAEDIYTKGKDNFTGYGCIDPEKLNKILSQENIPVLTTQNFEEGPPCPVLNDVLNFPNPFGREGTQFGFTTNQAGEIIIRIFDQRGRLQRTLTTNTPDRVSYCTENWDGRDESGQFLSNATYFYVIEFSTRSQKLFKKGKLTILN